MQLSHARAESPRLGPETGPRDWAPRLGPETGPRDWARASLEFPCPTRGAVVWAHKLCVWLCLCECVCASPPCLSLSPSYLPSRGAGVWLPRPVIRQAGRLAWIAPLRTFGSVKRHNFASQGQVDDTIYGSVGTALALLLPSLLVASATSIPHYHRTLIMQPHHSRFPPSTSRSLHHVALCTWWGPPAIPLTSTMHKLHQLRSQQHCTPLRCTSAAPPLHLRCISPLFPTPPPQKSLSAYGSFFLLNRTLHGGVGPATMLL